MTADKQHARDPDPHGGFVAFLCDLLQGYAAGRIELDVTTQAEVARRAQKLKLRPLDVWNAVVTLAHALGRKKGTPSAEAGDNS
jgi:hypothetical protein